MKNSTSLSKRVAVVFVLLALLFSFSCEPAVPASSHDPGVSGAASGETPSGVAEGYAVSGGDYFFLTEKKDMSAEKKALLNLYNVCDNAGKAFLYAALPTKSSVFGIEGDHSAENERELASALEYYFIDSLRPDEFTDITKEDFRKTDGGFTAEGAFKVYGSLLRRLEDYYTVSYGTRENVFSDGQSAESFEKVTLSESYTGEYARGYAAASGSAGELPTEKLEFLTRSTGMFSARYEGDSGNYSTVSYSAFGKAFTSTDKAAMEKNSLSYVLSDSYPLMKLSNTKLDMKLVVIHNLADAAPLAYLAQQFGTLYAFDMTKTSSLGTAADYVSGSAAQVVVLLIDPSRPVTNLYSGADVENLALKNKDRAVRTKTREVVVYSQRVDVTSMANRLVSLGEKLKKMDCGLIYVSAPPKCIVDYTEAPEGFESHTAENIDDFLSQISGKVDYIDCRVLLEERNFPKSEWFYRSDHHWRETAAFEAYIGIIEKLKKDYSWTDVDPDGRNTNKDNFNFELHEKYYVGSQTRGFNIHYVGYDDFYLISPKFETSMTYMRTPLTGGITKKGDYLTAVIDKTFLDTSDPVSVKYAAYIGGDRTHNRILNDDPTCSDKKVLIVEDSFSLPVDCFMSLNFKELNIMDIRYGYPNVVSEMAQKCDADMVIVVYTPESLYSRQIQFMFS